MVEHLFSVPEALGSIPSTVKKYECKVQVKLPRALSGTLEAAFLFTFLSKINRIPG